MKRILFVDDEPKVLDGLQRMLRPQRKEWEMVFAGSAKQALDLLEAAPFDVLVTDVRMPEMDGVALLEEVQRKFPSVIRIVLSGYFEREAALEAAGVAHQYLTKPCDPETLCGTVARLCRSAAILGDDGARRVVSAIGSLPSLPATCAALLQALQQPDVRIEEVAGIIEQDVAMTAKVLQLVNSRLFGMVCEMASVERAVGYLGLETLKQLVVSAEIIRTFEPEKPVEGFTLEEFQDHCRLAARIAAELPAASDILPGAIIAALLHDVGKLVLAARLPQQFAQALEGARVHGWPLYAAEEESIGANHAEIGGYLLSLWGLPQAIVDAVRWHHQPSAAGGSPGGLDVLALTHIANALAREVRGSTAGKKTPCAGAWNFDYLIALGVADQVPAWRAMATRLAAAA